MPLGLGDLCHREQWDKQDMHGPTMSHSLTRPQPARAILQVPPCPPAPWSLSTGMSQQKWGFSLIGSFLPKTQPKEWESDDYLLSALE